MDTQTSMLQEAQTQPVTLENPSAIQGQLTGKAKGWANLKPQRPGEPSRNPRGRPKKDLDLAALAQQHAQKAIETLVSVMSNEDATPAARVSAAGEILDRGFGRAPQSIDMNATMTLSSEFEQFIRMLNAGAGAKVIDQVVDAAE